MGKAIGVIVAILAIWGSLASIMPNQFQIRSSRNLGRYTWGQNSKWIALMVIGCLMGWYIWNLEGRLSAISARLPKTSIALVSKYETALRFATWSVPNNSNCFAIVDASRLKSESLNKLDIALVCGIVDPSTDKMQDTRITVSKLFTPQTTLPISVPFSQAMSEALDSSEDAAIKAMSPRPPHGTNLKMTARIWMRLAVLPKGFDIGNIHSLQDVASNGGKLSGEETIVTINVSRHIQ